jgi:hypothetical protein
LNTVSQIFAPILLAGLLFTSCNNVNTENNLQDSTAVQQPEPVTFQDSIITWQFDSDKDMPVQEGKKYFDSLTAEKLMLFAGTDKVRPDFVKISHDTIFIRIKDSKHLTQRMGTTGARAFMSVTTYTLTELKGIRYVNFDFTEGDHAVPGTYSRDDFARD